MRLCGLTSALLILAGLSACQQSPSYSLRWTLEGQPQLSAALCAEAGLFQIRARTYEAPGTFTDELLFPCFPRAFEDPQGVVSGATLPPGRYAIQVRGIDRTGNPWDDEDDGISVLDPDGEVHVGCNPTTSYTECRPNELVCGCYRLVVTAQGDTMLGEDNVVAEGSTVELPTYVLEPPPQCRDGIDNDVDGLVDGQDPSCSVDAGAAGEGVPVGVTELQLTLTLLGQNPAALCTTVPLRQLQLGIELEGRTEVLLEEQCRLDRPYLLSARLPEGTYTFSAIGLGSDGEPVTTAKTFEGQISSVGGTITERVDFAPEDFLEPIEGSVRVTPSYIGGVGLDALPRVSCSPEVGGLTLSGLRMRVLNAHGGELSSPVRLDDGTPLDGSEVIPCGSVLNTESLVWGGYQLELEALADDGTVCFSSVGQPAPLRPLELQTIYVPRVYGDDGSPPASCRECEDTGSACEPDGSGWTCVEGACQRPCEIDDDCLAPGLGDLGFVCGPDDGLCHPPGLDDPS